MHALSTTHPMLKITQSAISQKPRNQKKKKVGWENIFLHLYTGFWGQNSKYPLLQKFGNFFDILAIGT